MIPLKIDTLLAGRVVEQNRVEYKEGWNPNDIIHTICAFANDYSNVNGGYLVIGVKAKNGIPQFPLAGVPKELLDDIQQEIFQYCNKIVPRYIPKIEVVNYHDSDVYLLYFLRESNSSLVQEINNLTLEEILVSLEVANETDTDHEIRNIGVLMFADHPEKLIPGAQIDLVWFHNEEAEASDDFTEKTFTGPIWKQIRDALDYIKNNVIVEKVVKIQGEAKAERYFNYPYNALEEALVNAEFHKLYRDPEPVEIRIYVDYIQIINYPGPYRWIDMDKFAAGKVRARKYRNRRIGEFLKDIDLSEKQSTGITKILRELQKNGSPEPEFETDEERTYLITTIRCREGFANGRMGESMGESVVEILSEHMSELEQKRMYVIIDYLHQNGKIRSNTAAELLNVQIKTAGSLLRKAEKFGILTSDGKTKSKVYFLK